MVIYHDLAEERREHPYRCYATSFPRHSYVFLTQSVQSRLILSMASSLMTMRVPYTRDT